MSSLEALQRTLQPLGLTLHPGKLAAWSPGGTGNLPVELTAASVDTLPVLGAYLKCQGDTEESPHAIGSTQGSLKSATERLKHLWAILGGLTTSGLSRQAAAALLRAYAGPASQHSLGLAYASAAEAAEYDNVLQKCWEELLDRPLCPDAIARLGLPARLGGVGAQLASTRRNVAFLSSWAGLLEEIGANIRASSVADCLDKIPRIHGKLSEAAACLAEQGAPIQMGAALSEVLRYPLIQRLLVEKVQKKNLVALRQQLHSHKQAEDRGRGGPGAAGFLMYPTEAICSMENVFWATAVRRRLGLSRPECATTELPGASALCRLTKQNGQMCGQPLDGDGIHACACQNGGGVLRRHGRLEKVTGGLASRWTHQEPLFEQRVPAWDRTRTVRVEGREEVRVEHAILDIEYEDFDGRRWIDVSVRMSSAGSTSDVSAAARRDGEASRRGEREKHARYPGERLVAFVVEASGRVGAEARQWLLSHVKDLPGDIQAKELTRAYKAISCCVQGQVARQLREAAGLR